MNTDLKMREIERNSARHLGLGREVCMCYLAAYDIPFVMSQEWQGGATVETTSDLFSPSFTLGCHLISLLSGLFVLCVCVCVCIPYVGLLPQMYLYGSILSISVCVVADVEAFISHDKYTVACFQGCVCVCFSCMYMCVCLCTWDCVPQRIVNSM